MISNRSNESSSSEPSSYQHMEQTLSRVTAKAGEDTQEIKSDNAFSSQENNDRKEAFSNDKVEEAMDTPGQFDDSAPHVHLTGQHESGTEDGELEPNEKLGEAASGSALGSSQTGPGPVVDGATCNSVALEPPPSEQLPKDEKTELRPLAPSIGEYASEAQEAASPHILADREISQESHSPDMHDAMDTDGGSRSSPSSNSSRNGPDATSKGPSSKSGSTLRRGKWTVEEETYVARVIQDFNSGFLNAPAGTTLRSYLSEKLQCDPMRITKKFTGDACIGKRVFHPAVRSAANAAAIDKAQAELDTLERRWRRRLEMQQRESAKKAAASAAAANAATGGMRDHDMIQGVPVALLSSAGQGTGPNGGHIGQSVVTQAASWLDRANAILKGNHIHNLPIGPSLGSIEQTAGESIDSMPNAEIENQMKEVQRLLYEGPQIQMTTAGLPNLLATGQRTSGTLDGGPPSPPEPADKRMRTGGTISGAEDAEALVGFLRSVRASAAAGSESS